MKKWILPGCAAILVLYLTLSWFYPLSQGSVFSRYSFEADEKAAEDYEAALPTLRQGFETDDKDVIGDLTYVLPIFEQDWIIGDNTAEVDEQWLDRQLSEVRQARRYLINTVAHKDPTEEQEEYLVQTINSVLEIERQLSDIMIHMSDSRTALHTRLNNLQMKYISAFLRLETVYEVSKQGRAIS